MRSSADRAVRLRALALSTQVNKCEFSANGVTPRLTSEFEILRPSRFMLQNQEGTEHRSDGPLGWSWFVCTLYGIYQQTC